MPVAQGPRFDLRNAAVVGGIALIVAFGVGLAAIILAQNSGNIEVRLGDDRMFVGIIRDITQRKEMERLKGEFVSTVSHELRTPLTSIRGSLGLITGGAVGKLSGKVSEMINVAEKSNDRSTR